MRIAVALVSVLAFSAAARAQDGRPAPRAEGPEPIRLSAAEAVRRALRNDVRLAAEVAGRDSAHALAREAGAPYDPVLTGLVRAGSSRVESETALAGADVVETDRLEATAGVQTLLPTGTSVGLRLENTRTDDNSTFASVNPRLRTRAVLEMRQPLLRDFGDDAHGARLEAAALGAGSADHRLREARAATALRAEEAYWTLVLARAEVDVRRGALGLAEEEVKLSGALRDAGRLAPTDVLQAEAGAAAQREALLASVATARTAEERLLRLVAPPARADDVEAYERRLEPSDAPTLPGAPVDVAGSVRTALRRRPDLRAARTEAEAAALQVRMADRASLPRLDLVGSVASDGLGRTYGESRSDLASGETLGWSVGVEVQVPIGNRLGGSRAERAGADERRARLLLRDLETAAVLEVREAARSLDTARERAATAAVARDLSERKLEAEHDRLAQGLSTPFLVSQHREELSAARIREARAKVEGRLAAARLRKAEGTILDDLGR
ncbi:MAG: TolC family protein [Planctomycetales bacterium]|nr:TolC family protein [Planctomycetales bacterium]